MSTTSQESEERAVPSHLYYLDEDVDLRKLCKQVLAETLLHHGITHKPNMGRNQLLKLFNKKVYGNRLQILNEYWQSLAQTETESDASNLDTNDYLSLGSSPPSSSVNPTYPLSHISLETKLPGVSHYNQPSPASYTSDQVGSQAVASDSSQVIASDPSQVIASDPSQVIASGSSQSSSSNRQGVFFPRPSLYHEASSYRSAAGPRPSLFRNSISTVDDYIRFPESRAKPRQSFGLHPIASSWLKTPSSSRLRFFAPHPFFGREVSSYHSTASSNPPQLGNSTPAVSDSDRLPGPRAESHQTLGLDSTTLSAPQPPSSSRQDTFARKSPFHHETLFYPNTESDSDNREFCGFYVNLPSVSQQQGPIDSIASSERHPSSAQTTVPNLGQKVPSEPIHNYYSRILFTKFIPLLWKTLVSIFIILIIYSLFFGLIYINIQITRSIPTKLPQLEFWCVPFILFFLSVIAVKLWKICYGFVKRRAIQRLIDTAARDILDGLEHKRLLSIRNPLFHPYSLSPIGDFYYRFIQDYPEYIDLWIEIFDVINNHPDVMIVRRKIDGEEIAHWDYRRPEQGYVL
ncbi:hypothetical protein BCV72DRAFT_301791 [Rhizopus microsporus var. microsporus]|uniref:Man1/Src1 C-terminal domain-containing protein n=2 Tax=Rhizopus microsporus TaxID=58291 RepID=A0A2G4SNG9_RHIZD|nr:uncharacterized protein RHIMIDRAFT_245404 [Rhizopus microsporus ATCC 52813]ORE10624.1 hypothetical protein BCV72DRAFT_301791 [Rhizopus microsporus var. microsporus]PHZ10292.1 hypothetical protein RHIMIDRAFT_245404 [Rhizopus microsporus ATCC 52813]